MKTLKKHVIIMYEPGICVWHFGWRDPAGRYDQYRLYALSHGGFYGKYLRKGDFFILARAGLHLVRSLRRWIKGCIFGNKEYAVIGRLYFMKLIPGILAGIRSQGRRIG